MGKLRQLQRNIQKNLQKQADEASKEISQSIKDTPNNCAVCNSTLDPKNPQHLDTWMIVQDGPEKVELFCDICYKDKNEK